MDCDVSFCNCFPLPSCSQNTNFHLICNSQIHRDTLLCIMEAFVSSVLQSVLSAVLSKKGLRPEDGCYNLDYI